MRMPVSILNTICHFHTYYYTTSVWKGGLLSFLLWHRREEDSETDIHDWWIQSVSTIWRSCLCFLTFSGQRKGVGRLAWQSISKLQFHDKKYCQHGNDLFKHLLNHFTTNINTWSVILTFHSDITTKAENMLAKQF